MAHCRHDINHNRKKYLAAMVMRKGRYGLKVVDWLLLCCLVVLATSFLLFLSNKGGKDDASFQDEELEKQGHKISR